MSREKGPREKEPRRKGPREKGPREKEPRRKGLRKKVSREKEPRRKEPKRDLLLSTRAGVGDYRPHQKIIRRLKENSRAGQLKRKAPTNFRK